MVVMLTYRENVSLLVLFLAIYRVGVTPGSSSSPSPAWLEDASSAELEDGFHPQMPEEEAGRQPTRRQAPARLALLPSKDDEDP
jgi:hypothetical protein